jgi:hypothetical protein
MRIRRLAAFVAVVAGVCVLAAPDGLGQPGPKGEKDFFKGGPGGKEREIVAQFDKDKDKRLNAEERKAAREFLKSDPGGRRPGFGAKGGFGMRGRMDPPKPGPRMKPDDVKPLPENVGLYDSGTLRTLFLDFENADWESELADFHNTDVEVPCDLTVDSKRYPNVGVHFRGMSSYMGVAAGYKRSLNLSLDFVDKKQRLYGSKTLNLLNSHEDASHLSTVLYSHIARQYIPAPKANLVKVVINGESWGLYVNVQQFDKEFVQEHFKTDKGARWKVSGSPAGRGGLEYLGDNVEDYKRAYEIKSGGAKDWQALVNLCQVLNQTPADKLEEALKPLVELDGLLWFLALDVALINNDGYWIRSSDYTLYRGPNGKFHFVPHDMNESFRPAGGPGMGGMMRLGRPGEIFAPPFQDMLGLTDEQRKQLAELQKEVDGRIEKLLTADQRKQLAELRDRGPTGLAFGPAGPGGFGPPPGGPMGGPPPKGPGGFGPPGAFGSGGVDLDPLVGLTDARKPLRSKVLAVPALRAKYLANVRTIAEKSLDWKALGPVVSAYRKLVEKEVEADTRKLSTTEAFQRATADVAEAGARGREMPLRAFADQRRKYLLDYKEPKAATR